MDKRKHYTAILDVESTGVQDNAIVYDVGLVIVDKKGNIQAQKDWIIKEVFENAELMASAYYIRHYAKYQRMIQEGKMQVVPFLQMKEEFNNLLDEWNVKTIAAYNLGFDSAALPNTMKFLQHEGKFLTHSCKILDLWLLFCETVGQQKSFRKFALKNWLFSEYGNIKTSAEVAYKYITNDTTFQEAHTALADCLIEAVIFANCMKQKKKYTKNKIVENPWKQVAKITVKEIFQNKDRLVTA